MNYDIWDKIRGQMRGNPEVPIEDDEQLQAMQQGQQIPQQPPQGAPQEMPPWASDAQRGMRQQGSTRRDPAGRDNYARPVNQYEGADEQNNRFLRERAKQTYDDRGSRQNDEPFPEAYENPEEFGRMVQGAYQAGLNNDRQAIEQLLNGPYANSPLGQQLKRAYTDGQRQRSAGRR
jgi:hypothetical protein